MDDEAVSPVIGVILMVAIAAFLAAVVFFVAQNFVDTDHDSENAAARVTSPASGVIHITIVKEGDKAPYTTADGEFNEYTVSIDAVACDNSELPDPLRAGSVIRLDAAVAGTCRDVITAGGTHSVVLTVAGTVILSDTVDVRS